LILLSLRQEIQLQQLLCRFCFRSRSYFNCYPSDHIIGNADLYEESMQAIDKANGFIVTFGIVPTNQKQDTDTLKEMAITYFLQRKPNQFRREILLPKKLFME
jgi:hypothetical protein